MPLILDLENIKKLERLKRTKRAREVKDPVKAKRQFKRDMDRLWQTVLYPATERIKTMVQSGASPESVALVMEQILKQAEFEYGVQVSSIMTNWKLSMDMESRAIFKKVIADSLGGIDIQAMIDDAGLQGTFTLASTEASSLIRSIPSRHLGLVAKAVADNFLGIPQPNGRTLLQQIESINGTTKKRAKVIARDQTGKLNAAINQARQQSIGIEMYQWATVRDRRVVGYPGGLYPAPTKPTLHMDHWAMEGLYCRWDDPTVYSDDKGKTWKPRKAKMPKNHPKQDILCRCYAEPVIDIQQIIAKARLA